MDTPDYAAKGYTQSREFYAVYPTVTQAQEFLANVHRVIATTGPDAATRSGRMVTFTAYVCDPSGYALWGDIELSVGCYGGHGTRLNGQICTRES